MLTSTRLLCSGGRLRPVLFHSKPGDTRDQIVRDRLVEWEPKISLLTGISRDRFLQTFVICNKVDEWLTGNLLGPIVVNAENRLAMQVVLTEKKWTTRQPLFKLQAGVPLAKSA